MHRTQLSGTNSLSVALRKSTHDKGLTTTNHLFVCILFLVCVGGGLMRTLGFGVNHELLGRRAWWMYTLFAVSWDGKELLNSCGIFLGPLMPSHSVSED